MGLFSKTEKKTWTYEEITHHAEVEIRKYVGLSLEAKHDHNKWREWRGYAYGTYLLWLELIRGHQYSKEGDGTRLALLIPDEEPPEIKDYTALILKILEIVDDDKRWKRGTDSQRGTIIGMCAGAGITLPE